MERNKSNKAKATTRKKPSYARNSNGNKALLEALGAEKLVNILLEGLGRDELEMQNLEQLAKEYAAQHRKAFENPATLGEIEKYWEDESGVVCIAYTGGNWYHYEMNGNNLEWY